MHNHRLSIIRTVRHAVNLWQWPLQAHTYKLIYLAGSAADDVRDSIKKAWDSEIVRRIYPGWLTAIPWLQAQNCTIVLLSGTPRPLARPLMDLLHIQHALCAEPEIIEQKYTGRLLKPHPKGRLKKDYAEEWLQMHGVAWKDTVAIANDWPDRFLLNRFRSVVVDSSRRLTRYAQRRHWPVISNPHNGQEIIECIAGQWENEQ